jgi:hypothetical protein
MLVESQKILLFYCPEYREYCWFAWSQKRKFWEAIRRRLRLPPGLTQGPGEVQVLSVDMTCYRPAPNLAEIRVAWTLDFQTPTQGQARLAVYRKT